MADDAEYLLQVQVSEMQQIGERLRSKLRTLWTNGTPSFAETFAEVWPQLPAGLRAEMVKSGTTWYVARIARHWNRTKASVLTR